MENRGTSMVPPFKVQKDSLSGVNLIEASAGTGKTFTLALLVVRLVIEDRYKGAPTGYTLQEIVTVTFTKAATAELQERIGKFLRLSRAYLEGVFTAEEVDNQSLTDYLDTLKDKSTALKRVQNALLELDNASIFTIHSFCQKILNDFAFESGAEFGKELITNQDDILAEIQGNFWRKEVLSLEKEIYDKVVKTLKSPATLHERVKSVLTFPQLKVEGLQSGTPQYELLLQEYQAALKPLFELWQESADEVEKLLRTFEGINRSSLRSNIITKIITTLHDGLSGGVVDITALSKLCFSCSFHRKKYDKILIDPNIYPQHPFLEKLAEMYPLIVTATEKIAAFDKLWATYIETRYINYLKDELSTVKEHRNQSSFDDIITGVYEALKPSNPRSNLLISLVQKRYKVALVDEFQDTDIQQFSIFKTLFAEQTLFMIGDPKQAIYQFRGGDIQAYLKVKEMTPAPIPYTLTQNYRSEPSLIGALNDIFEKPTEHNEAPFLTEGVPYYPIDPKSSRQTITNEGEVVPPVVIWRKAVDKLTKIAVVDDINRHVVAEISHLLTGKWEIGEQEKRKQISAGDCAILISSHKEATELKRLLNRAHIPAVTPKTGSLYSSDEALLLLGILKSLENPQNSALLKGVLYNAPFSRSTEHIEATLLEYMAFFVELNELWQESGVIRALEKLFNTYNLYSTLITQGFEGYRPLTNYRHLFEIIHLVEAEQGIAPLRLIAEFSRMVSEGGTEQEQRLESDEDAVKIITIHSSKGLEFPIVFVPYPWTLDYHWSKSSDIKKIVHPLYHSDDGLILDIAPTANKDQAIREKNEEFQRLFYVALTRASQRLYLSSFESSEAPLNPSMRFLEPFLETPPQEIIEDEEGTVQETSHDTTPPVEKMTSFTSLHPSIEWRDLEEPAEVIPYTPSELEGSCERVRHFDKKIAQGKKTKSYSSVMKHPPHTIRPYSVAEPHTIFAFKKGARTGNAWHEIFEVIRYDDSKHHTKRITEVMKKYGFSGSSDSETATLLAPVIKMVDYTLSTELTFHRESSFRLSDLKKSQILTEMSFYLKAHKVSLASVKAIIDDLGGFEDGYSPSVKEGDFSGYLQGFIDLTFEHNGVYYIADWKSNHLGNSSDDYTSEKLYDAMVENEYHLQYILYTVALTRYLQATLADFEYEKHFGGAYYVFLRGVTREGTTGFYFNRPRKEMIDALLHHFETGEPYEA